MRTFTALIHKAAPDETGFWATCLEVPGANGQGETRQECLDELATAIRVMLDVERDEALRNDPNAEEATVAVA